MIETGICPKCDVSGNLNYGVGFVQDSYYGYPVSCPDCGFTGTEWYNMEFIYFTDDNGDEME